MIQSTVFMYIPCEKHNWKVKNKVDTYLKNGLKQAGV